MTDSEKENFYRDIGFKKPDVDVELPDAFKEMFGK